ncbi:MAG: metalloprotease TldD [Succinivibrionaceae bacterium]
MNSAQEIINQVESSLLHKNGVDCEKLNKLLNNLNQTGIDFGDIYFQNSVSENWSIVDSCVKSGSFSISQGVGVRGVVGDKTALAYSDEINEDSIKQSVRIARSIGSSNRNVRVNVSNNATYPIYNNGDFSPINYLSRDEKINILYEMDSFARSLDSRVIQVIAHIDINDSQFLVANTLGKLAAEITPRVLISCVVIVESKGIREKGSSASGRYSDLSYYFQEVPVISMDYIHGITDLSNQTYYEKRYLAIARDAVRAALVNLEAQSVIAGNMPVVLASGWPAVLIHEAVGHGLEADSIRKGRSIYADKIGTKVASSLCTIVDDGTLLNGTGSFNIDDEGEPAKRNVLIEDGVLVDFLYDRMNAMLMNKKSTGNGRRMSYSCNPIPRMTNTYLLPGQSTPNEIISSVDYGIYAVNFNGGQVDTASGKFTFSASEAYLIEKGVIKYPLKGATLIGSGMDAMQQISMVGNNLEFDKGIGSCGKAGQGVPVGIGQPTIKLESITIGGTK